MNEHDEWRQALLRSDPRLSRFDPLGRIVFHDDFDDGLLGWSAGGGQLRRTLDTMLEPYKHLRAPMLSNLTVWDTGTTGSLDGCYALKLATRPRPGNVAMAIKRLTRRFAGPIRAEYYFSFKPEASEMRLSDRDVRCIAFGFDLQESDRAGEGARRVHPIVRYLNSYEGRRVGHWQYKKDYTPFHKIGGTGETVSFYAYGDDHWEDIPGGEQRLCYNEIATKINWHYLCFDFDLATMTMTSLRCNDRTFLICAASGALKSRRCRTSGA